MDVTDSYRDDRYHRQTSLEAIGIDGQRRLRQARVLVVGAGGLGSPLIEYLAAAGVGSIGIVDDDTVSASNLNRQILYYPSQEGKPKANCAADVVRRMNPDCKVQAYRMRLTDSNASDLFGKYDVIADCTDNLATRYVIDRHTKALGIPFVHGSLCEFEGRVAVFNYKGGTSYEELFPFDADGSKLFSAERCIGSIRRSSGHYRGSGDRQGYTRQAHTYRLHFINRWAFAQLPYHTNIDMNNSYKTIL